MKSLAKRLLGPAVILICGFLVGRFYQHSNTGYHFELLDEKTYSSKLGEIQWERVTDSVGTPFLDAGTTRIRFDNRLIYEAKRNFQENTPAAQNVVIYDNRVSWDDGDYSYNLEIIPTTKSKN